MELHLLRHYTNSIYSVLITQTSELIEPEAETGGSELYFEVLELQPIKFSISFMRTERVSSEEQ